MPARKRTHDEVEEEIAIPKQLSLLERVRNTWEFASLMQYIFFFGQAVKIGKDLDVEMLETECIKPGHSELLSEIGLALLKYVSSHKGLTPEIFDEYTRRQFVAKAPDRNPYGTDEIPRSFTDFDVFTKLRVLYQLSTWTLNNPDRIREKMEEKENEQTQWRIEPLGWDADERTYFVLDDDRLYRRTEPPPPPSPPKVKSKPKPKRTKGRRTSKRQKLSEPKDDSTDEEEDQLTAQVEVKMEEMDDGLGGAKWECIAVTLAEYNNFLETIRKSRDADEKALFKRVTVDVLPVIEKRAESQERKIAQRRRELENLERLATAKRSSRLADKQEKQKEIQMAEEAERKRRDDLAMAKQEQDRQQKLEEARESRMVTREQRLKDREVKRILHEEELARLRSSSEEGSQVGARVSERSRKLELEKTQKELEKLNEDEEEWYFDCAVCGVHGKNLDDGSHSIACEKCNVWQHSACHGIKENEAESDDFHFICASCKRPKVTSLKLRLGPLVSPQNEKAHVNGVNGSQPAHTDGEQVQTQTPATNAAPTSSRTSTIGNTVSSRHGDTHPDRYLARSQGRASPSTLPSGHSILTPQTSVKRATTQEDVHANGTGSQETLPIGRDHHNPFLNHFDRQRSTSSQQEKTTAIPLSPIRGNFTTPAVQNNTTIAPTPYMVPFSNYHSTNLANSPTPSLSATQGNVSIRFSPTPKPAGSPRSSSYISVSAENAFQQAPARAALSPTKSSPPQVRSPPAFLPNGVASTPAIALGDFTTSAVAGMSPTKSSMPLTLGGTMDAVSWQHQQQQQPQTLHVQPVSPTETAPLLSPTFDHSQRYLQPPVKKQTPVKEDVEREGWMQVPSAPRPLNLGLYRGG